MREKWKILRKLFSRKLSFPHGLNTSLGIEVAQAALQEAAKKYDEIYASIGPTTVRMRETLQQLSSAINACKEHGGGSAGKQCCKNLEMAMQASKLARLNAGKHSIDAILRSQSSAEI